MTRVLLALAVASVLVGSAVAVDEPGVPGSYRSPRRLPARGGIAAAGEQFYVGSILTGDIYRGSLRTGQGSVFVDAAASRQSIGMKVDRGRLFVAGGPTGDAYVYNARTGRPSRRTSSRRAARRSSTTSSSRSARRGSRTRSEPPCSRLPPRPERASGSSGFGDDGAALRRLPARGGRLQRERDRRDPEREDARDRPDGRGTAVHRHAERRDEGRSRSAPQGESVQNGDGILLDGRTLYVVQNQLNRIAKINLAPSLRSGRVVTRITSPDFSVPTTIAELGRRLYAVNAVRHSEPVHGRLLGDAGPWVPDRERCRRPRACSASGAAGRGRSRSSPTRCSWSLTARSSGRAAGDRSAAR